MSTRRRQWRLGRLYGTFGERRGEEKEGGMGGGKGQREGIQIIIADG